MKAAPHNSSRRPTRLLCALLAGAFAIAANMALLIAAGAAGITTAHGSLLTLTVMLARKASAILHFSSGWVSVALPQSSSWFKNVFHAVTGLAMAVAYAMVIERTLPGTPLVRGSIYGAVVWLVNAFVVLPIIGEGVAGHEQLQASGIVCFAIAHMAFFMLTAVLYSRLLAHFLQTRTTR